MSDDSGDWRNLYPVFERRLFHQSNYAASITHGGNGGPDPMPPVWVRIDLHRHHVTGCYSMDGGTWVPLGDRSFSTFRTTP